MAEISSYERPVPSRMRKTVDISSISINIYNYFCVTKIYINSMESSQIGIGFQIPIPIVNLNLIWISDLISNFG
jgi:hypothetical protein